VNPESSVVHGYETWTYIGKKPRRRNDGVACAYPTLLRKGDEEIEGRCGSAKEKKCEYCGRIHSQFVKAVVKSGFDGIDSDKPLEIEFVTLTALGADRLPWDKSKCNHIEALECSGAIGCKVDEFTSAIWNDEAKQNWNWLVTELERALDRDLPYFKCFELQTRGVLHIHALVHVPGITHERFESVLKEIAAKWDFGPMLKTKRVTGKNRAGAIAYVAKYVTKGSAEGFTIDRTSGEIRKGGYRAWSASRDWGLSMAQAKSLLRDKWVQRALERLLAEARRDSAQGAGTTRPASAEGALDDLYEKLRN